MIKIKHLIAEKTVNYYAVDFDDSLETENIEFICDILNQNIKKMNNFEEGANDLLSKYKNTFGYDYNISKCGSECLGIELWDEIE